MSITPDSWTGVEGSSFNITAVVTPDNASDKSLKWESTDKNVATVDGNGNVTVVKAGTCKIVVSTLDGSNLTAECLITGISGIDQIFSEPETCVDVYDLNGVVVKRGCTREEFKELRRGVYVVGFRVVRL